MSDKTISLTPPLYQYLLDHSLREPEILRKLRNETSKLRTAKIAISPDQGQFMALLVTLLQAKKTIDVGTFTGYSALCVALALPADGKVIACDVNEETSAIAKDFWRQAKVENKVTLHLRKAEETLQSLIQQGEAGTFDFIFIDADKENNATYYELALKLLRVGGMVAIDNVLWHGTVADLEVNDRSTLAIREFNDSVHHDQRVTMSMVPIGDGLTLAIKKE